MDDMNLTALPGMIPDDVLPELMWYGVLHVNGTLSIKRYFSWADFKEAGDSDFTEFCTRIFEAPTRGTALDEAQRLIRAHHEA